MTVEHIAGPAPTSSAPELWAERGWRRPHEFLRSAASAPPAAPREVAHALHRITSGFGLARALDRTSLTKVDTRSIAPSTQTHLVRSLYEVVDHHRSLFCGLHTQGVNGWPDGWWLLDTTPRQLRSTFATPQPLAPLIQGQAWADGPGFAVVLGVDWEYLAAEFSDVEYGYASTLVDCGRAGQSLLLAMQEVGMAARMTPAVAESLAREALALKPEQEALYFLRLAHPAIHPFD